MGEALQAAETAPEAGNVRNFATSSDLQHPNLVDLQPAPSAISPAKSVYGLLPCSKCSMNLELTQRYRDFSHTVYRAVRSRNCAAISNHSITLSKGHRTVRTCGYNKRSACCHSD